MRMTAHLEDTGGRAGATLPDRRPVRVVAVGVGEMGKKLCLTLLDREGVDLVAVCDHDPLIAGRDLGDVLGLGRSLGLVVNASVDDVFAGVEADVALLCTVTDLDELTPQVMAALAAGCHVVSTSEPLSWSWRTFPDQTRRLDEAARQHGRSVLGTGVCPGFLPDVLPVVATLGCREIQHIDIRIFGDVYPYGPTVWKGMGLGLTEEEYRRRLGGEVDIEFAEPLDQVVAALGLQVDDVREQCEPLLAPHDIRVGALEVGRGRVCGFLQTTAGYRGDTEVIRLTVDGPLCCDLPPFRLEVKVTGKPNVRLRLELEHEDGWATSGVVANVVPLILEAPPGVISMKDLRLPGATLGARTSRR
jgi:2,4-diaminopentanoate dehydrogenase